MNSLKCFSAVALRVATRPRQVVNVSARGRNTSECHMGQFPPHKRDCFDIRNVELERGNQCHAHVVKTFLNIHYWPREPTVTSLWLPLDSPYLEILTDMYSNSGDRVLAYENIPRTGERKLVGLAVAMRVYPWTATELEEWGLYTDCRPEKGRMYFTAHCLKAPNLFVKYKAEYIYHIEVLGTSIDATGQGVGELLLRATLDTATDAAHPVTQVTAVSTYAAKICERVGMKKEWSMSYMDYVDDFGQRVFCPRTPHHSVTVYSQPFDNKSSKRGEFTKILR